MSFEKSLNVGRVAEGAIAKWAMSRGAYVMPAYEIAENQYKGPQFFSEESGFVAPDMLVFAKDKQLWIEAKHKTVFTWHRNTSRWTTGIDIHHYNEYKRVSELSRLDVWILFLHRESTPNARDIFNGCPDKCPVGLFGGEIAYLAKHENHRSRPLSTNATQLGHGKSGMVYWASDKLTKLATVEEVYGDG